MIALEPSKRVVSDSCQAELAVLGGDRHELRPEEKRLARMSGLQRIRDAVSAVGYPNIFEDEQRFDARHTEFCRLATSSFSGKRDMCLLDSDHREPTGLCAGTKIATEDGLIFVEDVRVGTQVQTSEGLLPVQSVSMRYCLDSEVQVLEIASGAFGLNDRVQLGASQIIGINGWQVELLFGCDLVAARSSDIATHPGVILKTASRLSFFSVDVAQKTMILGDGIYFASGYTQEPSTWLAPLTAAEAIVLQAYL